MATLPTPGSQNKTNSTRTVSVACRLPHGLTLRVFSMIDTQEPISGGGMRSVKVARDRGDRVRLNGFSHPQNAAPLSQITEGFALTQGVDKDFWELWLSQNKDSDIVRNGLIFAHEEHRSTEAEAKEKKDLKSGLERLDPKNLPKGLKTATSSSV